MDYEFEGLVLYFNTGHVKQDAGIDVPPLID